MDQNMKNSKFIHSLWKQNHIEDCRICLGDLDHEQTLLEYFFHQDIICHKCREQFFSCLLDEHVCFQSINIWILYQYQEELESLIYQFKEQRDIALAPVFFHRFKRQIQNRYQAYTIIPMPSSQIKIKERGFHHLEEMIKEIPLPICYCLKKIGSYKQANQSAKQRKKIASYIELEKQITLPNTPLLLIDDVCTTGATLQAAYALLKDHPYPVEALVLSAHPWFVESCDEK